MRAILAGAAFAVALGLSSCATGAGSLGAPQGDSAAALEMYRIYASRCSSTFAAPFTASVTCERTSNQPDLAAQAKIIAEAVAKAVTEAMAARSGPLQ